MTFRSACLLAAAALAAAAAPAFAQDGRYDPGAPPPLPEAGVSWDEYPDSTWEERERHSDAHGARPGDWRAHPIPAPGTGYAPEQRHAWLEECRATGRGPDECEGILMHYEQGFEGRGYAEGGYAHGYRPGAYGYHYPYPYPVMWVKVPIHTVRRGDCGCETVVEEWVEEAPAAPPRIRRVAPAPDKRVKIQRTR